MKRAERRWRTFKIRNCRARKFANSGMFKYGVLKDGQWVHNRSRIEQVDYIKENQFGMLEDPTLCSCSMCSAKNSWHARSEKRRMRNEERQKIREFYRFEKD